MLIEPQLYLSARNWQRATWRPFTPLPKPDAVPFDWKQLQTKFRAVFPSKKNVSPHWRNVTLSVAMKPREAHYWLDVMCAWAVHGRKKWQSSDLGLSDPNKYTGVNLDWEHIRQLLVDNIFLVPAEVVVPLSCLFPLPDVCELFYDTSLYNLSPLRHIRFWCEQVLPYVTEAERTAVRQPLLTYLQTQPWPRVSHKRLIEPGFLLAAAIGGLQDFLLEGVQQWDDDEFGSNPHRTRHNISIYPQELILGLGHPELVVSQMQRFRLPLRRKPHVWAWLAHTETTQLDYIAESILSSHTQYQARSMTTVYGEAVQSKQTAQHMLAIAQDSLAGAVAQTWLDTHAPYSVAGLLPLAQKRSKVGQAAVGYLRKMARSGQTDLIRDLAPPEQLEALLAEEAYQNIPPLKNSNTPDWLRKGVATTFAFTPPDWIQATTLPPILLDENRLNQEQTTAVLAALSAQKANHQTWLLQQLHQHASPDSLDAFVWQLLEAWEFSQPKKSEWVFQAVGFFGSPQIAVQLASKIRDWESKKKAEKVKGGLDALAEMTHDTAALQLYMLYQKLSRKHNRLHADKALTANAKRRNLTRDELADVLVPECGLDENGRRTFDYGSRQFHFIMGPELTPYLQESDTGKIRKTLPSYVRKDDDPQLVEQAKADWSLFRKQIKDAVAVQAHHLQRGMVQRWCWSWQAFEDNFLHHPLMRHFTQFLLWGVFVEGTLVQAFRVTDSFDFANVADDVTTLHLEPIPLEVSPVEDRQPMLPPISENEPTVTDAEKTRISPPLYLWRRVQKWWRSVADLGEEDALLVEEMVADVEEAGEEIETAVNLSTANTPKIGLVHPLMLTPEQRTQWNEQFLDYELLPPFPQLGRPIYELSKQQLVKKEYKEFADHQKHVLSLRGALEKQGWQTAYPTYYNIQYKKFPAVTAVVQQAEIQGTRKPGQPYASSVSYKVESLFFVLEVKRHKRADVAQAIPLKDIDSITLSEAIHDITKAIT